MKKFQINDKVIALTNPGNQMSQYRVKGQIYSVKGVSFCSGCGDQRINIGQAPKPSNNKNVICVGCGSEQNHLGLAWTNSKYFAKVEKEDIEEEMEKAEVEEDYEFAAILRDTLK